MEELLALLVAQVIVLLARELAKFAVQAVGLRV